MTFDELKREAQEDLKIDEENMEKKSLEISSLYGKYLEYFRRFSEAYTKAEHQRDQKYAELYEYYSTQYHVKLKNNEVPTYIKGNEEYQKLDKRVKEIHNSIQYIEGVLKQIGQMSFNIRNSIEFKKFKEGLF